MNCKKIVCKTFYLIVLSVFIFSGTAYSLRPPLVSDADLIAAYNQRRAAAFMSTAISKESERLIIEKAREDDLTELLEFRDKYFKEEIVGYNEEFDVNLYRMKLAEIIRGRNPGAVIVARSQGKIIGYAVSKLLPDSISIGEIAEIAVHPDYQNLGVGKELFGLVLDGIRSSPMVTSVIVEDFSRSRTISRNAVVNFGFSPLTGSSNELILGDIDLRDRLGLPIRLTRGKIESVRSKKFFLRFEKKLARVNPVAYSPNPTDGAIHRLVHYRSYCNVSEAKDTGRLIGSNLSYDLLVLYPSHSFYTERERLISAGVHYTKKCEVVQVVFGDEAWMLLQKDVSGKGTTGEIEPCLIKVKEGQKVLIPPGYGYSIINPLSTKPLIVATWRHADSRGKKQLYKEGKPAYAAEYYYNEKTGAVEIRFKPSIDTLPLLREIELESMQLNPGLASETSLYDFGHKPELLRRLIDDPIDRPLLIVSDTNLIAAYNKRQLSAVPMSTTKVALSILSAPDFGLVEEVREAKSAGVDIIHVDYLDGKFTPGSEPFDCAEQIRKISHIDIPLEVHIMASAPAFSLIDKMIEAGLKPGRDRVLIHYESFEDKKDFRDIVAKIKTSGLNAGIVLNPETPVSVLNEFLDYLGTTLNSITIMAIVPGAGKRPFIPTTLEKIRELKKILYDNNINNVEIETDGGINEGTLEKIIKADINLFVSRSWLVEPSRGLEKGIVRIREICGSLNLERKAIKEALQESGLSIDRYTLDSIIDFCNGSEVFLEKDIVSYLEHIPGVTSVLINKGRVVDIYFNKRLVRFHKRGVVPIEHLGLEDRAYYKGIALKVYAGNIALTGKGEYALGISGSWHDSTAVLLKNGRIVSALEEERMTRVKHDTSRFPVNAIHRLLKEEGITLEDISHISIGWNYNEYVDTPHSVNPNQEFFEDMDERYAKINGIPVDRIIRRNVPEKNKKRFDIGRLNEFLEELKEYYGTDYTPRVSFVRHHLAHAASAYYACGFKEPVLTVVLDGYGDTESGSVWIGRDGALEPIKQFNLPNSLGWVWAAITEYLGFKPTLEEGQVMGFAPYGEPRNDTERKRVEELRNIFEEYIYFDPEKGELLANPAYLYYGKMANGKVRVTEAFVERLGKLVPPCTKNSKNIDPLLEEDRPYANLAFVLQEVTNNIITDFIRYYLQKDPRTKGIKKVAFGGGIALNILANGKIISEGLVKGDDIFVQPAASDAGTAIGAALAVEREIYGEGVNFEMSHAFYGPEYSNDDIKRVLDGFHLVQGVDYEKVDDNALVEKAAQCIKRNKPIAWFQGRCEIGPRALGNRSILLNLMDDTANNTANIIKGRQAWRPSASSISERDAKDYFEGIAKSPFMVIAYDVLPDKKRFMASGVHQYGKRLARPQTVDEMSSPLYSRLLKRVGELVGVPAVVNTSFNKREPLVESPEEAINAFFYMKDVTRLFIGNYIVTRRKAIKPTIISLLDERFLNGSLKKAISTGDINDWDALFDMVNRERPGNYKIKVTLDCGVYGTREISIPLAKELFEGSLKAILMRYVASSIYNYAIEFQAEKIYIGSDSDKMDEVVYYLMRDYLKENFKRMDFFANSGREVKILSMREKSKIEKGIDSSKEYFVRPLGQEAIEGIYIGVDVGASRIKCSVLEDGKEIRHKVVDTTIDGGEALKLLINGLIKDMAGNSKVSGIGISLPGVVDSNSNSIIWLVNYEHRWKRTRGSSGEEVDFKGDYDALNSVITELKEEYGIDNVGILNDATSFGVAALNVEKETDAVIVSIGTGVGAARLEDGLIDAGRIEQSGGFVVNVKEDAPFDEGCSVKGCFASYIGAGGIIDISRRLGLSGILGEETLSVAAIIHLLESGSGIGYAEANRIYDIVARHIVSWIELMHKMRGDSRFIISGGVTAGQAGNVLLDKINNILKEREDISAALSKVDREYGGAIGAAFFAMAKAREKDSDNGAAAVLHGVDRGRLSSL